VGRLPRIAAAQSNHHVKDLILALQYTGAVNIVFSPGGVFLHPAQPDSTVRPLVR
jgi:hypothetical protein